MVAFGALMGDNGAVEDKSHSVEHRLGAKSKRGRERADDRLIRDLERTERAGSEMRLTAVELLGT